MPQCKPLLTQFLKQRLKTKSQQLRSAARSWVQFSGVWVKKQRYCCWQWVSEKSERCEWTSLSRLSLATTSFKNQLNLVMAQLTADACNQSADRSKELRINVFIYTYFHIYIYVYMYMYIVFQYFFHPKGGRFISA